MNLTLSKGGRIAEDIGCTTIREMVIGQLKYLILNGKMSQKIKKKKCTLPSLKYSHCGCKTWDKWKTFSKTPKSGVDFWSRFCGVSRLQCLIRNQETTSCREYKFRHHKYKALRTVWPRGLDVAKNCSTGFSWVDPGDRGRRTCAMVTRGLQSGEWNSRSLWCAGYERRQ